MHGPSLQYLDVWLFQVSITLGVGETVVHVCPETGLMIIFQKSRANPNTAFRHSGLQVKFRPG